MNQCWPEGTLRAYLDGELPPDEMQSVAAHLGECAACERLHTELSVRAGVVSGLMETLAEPLPQVPRRRAPAAAAIGSWRWTAAAVALAAGLAVASFFLPKREAPRVPVAVAPPPEQAVPVIAKAPSEVPALPPAAAAPKTRRAALRTEHFLALDNEPFESGIVMRVTLPGSTPADIVFSPDGRARAIRLVNGNQRSY